MITSVIFYSFKSEEYLSRGVENVAQRTKQAFSQYSESGRPISGSVMPSFLD